MLDAGSTPPGGGCGATPPPPAALKIIRPHAGRAINSAAGIVPRARGGGAAHPQRLRRAQGTPEGITFAAGRIDAGRAWSAVSETLAPPRSWRGRKAKMRARGRHGGRDGKLLLRWFYKGARRAHFKASRGAQSRVPPHRTKLGPSTCVRGGAVGTCLGPIY